MDEMTVDITGNNKTKDYKAVSQDQSTYNHVFIPHTLMYIKWYISCNKTQLKQIEDKELD